MLESKDPIPLTFTYIAKKRTRKTNIMHEKQSGDQWCWAACIYMVIRALGRSLTQCEVAGIGLGDPCRKNGPCTKYGKAKQKCDKAYVISEIEGLWNNSFKVLAHDVIGTLAWTDLRAMLETGYGVEILLGPGITEGHLLLIVDLAAGNRVLVADPSPDNKDLSPKDYRLLKVSTRWGKWQRTWTDLHF